MRSYQHKVQYYETDRMGITHHSNYIRWMEEARIDFLEQIGWGYEKLEELGVVSPVVAVDCQYKHSTTFSDLVEITVTLEEFRGIRFKLRYEMTDQQGNVVCIAHSQHAFLGKDGKMFRLKKELPEFYALMESLVRPAAADSVTGESTV